MTERIQRLSKRATEDSNNVFHLPVRERNTSDRGLKTSPTGHKAIIRRFPGVPEPSLPVEGLKRVQPLGQSPSSQQKRWLECGLQKDDGKLPLFDEQGQAISDRTVKTCVARGWVEPLFSASKQPPWTVCRLTDLGRAMVS